VAMGPKSWRSKRAAQMVAGQLRSSPVVVDGGAEEESAMDETPLDDPRAKPDEPYRKGSTKKAMEQLSSTVQSWFWTTAPQAAPGGEDGGDLDGNMELQMVLKETPTRELVQERHNALTPGGSHSACKEEKLLAVRGTLCIWLHQHGREVRGEALPSEPALSLVGAARQAASLLSLGEKSVQQWTAEYLQTEDLLDKKRVQHEGVALIESGRGLSPEHVLEALEYIEVQKALGFSANFQSIRAHLASEVRFCQWTPLEVLPPCLITHRALASALKKCGVHYGDVVKFTMDTRPSKAAPRSWSVAFGGTGSGWWTQIKVGGWRLQGQQSFFPRTSRTSTPTTVPPSVWPAPRTAASLQTSSTDA
ncbi:hypothetical protein B484DRAFT_438067, partial [Ochromonadaceae sp. CCMP2298]